MSKLRHMFFLGIAFLALGCPARSLFPLFAEKELVFNPLLVGTWGSEGKAVVTFQRSGEKGYTVIVSEKDADTSRYRGQLGQLKKYWFLVTAPSGSDRDHHLLPSYVIHRVWLNQDTLRIASLEDDWLRNMADKNELRIPHVRRDGEIILTASTKELQKFVLRHADNEKAFPNPGPLVRMK